MDLTAEEVAENIIAEVDARNIDKSKLQVGITHATEDYTKQRHCSASKAILNYYSWSSNKDADYIYKKLVGDGFEDLGYLDTTPSKKRNHINVFYLEPRPEKS